jgi:mannose-6-phosphate isomerase-like protein (cupin superfamily)
MSSTPAPAKGKGYVAKITKDTPFVKNPPKHLVTNAYPMINPKVCPGAQLEFHITEIYPDGAALDDIHPNEDHVFFVISGRAMAKVGDDDFLVEPGDALYVPKNTIHNFRIQGGEVFRIGVVFAPPRPIWG